MSGSSGGSSSNLDKVYTEEELNALTVNEIKAIATERGYSITSTTKADIIVEFLAAQSAA